MKCLRLIITTLVLCIFNSHSLSSQERTVEDDIFYFDAVSEVLQDCFQGWVFDRDSRQWYGNPNVIRADKMSWVFRKAKNSGFEYSRHYNIYNLQSASFVWKMKDDNEPKRYYVLFWQKWDGAYEYPNIQEDWYCFRVYDYYIFPEEEWKRFQDIQAGETIYLKYDLYGNVENDNAHFLNDDIEHAVKTPFLHSVHHKQDDEGMYSFYVRFADDGENIRFFINPKYSVRNSDKRYFEVKYSIFAKLMKLTDENHLGKEVIRKGTTYYH